MGYTPDEDILRLKFVDRDGLEVDVESTSVDNILRLMALADLAESSTGAEQAKAAEELICGFQGCLRRWNVEIPSGRPVPTTVEGVKSLKFPFAFEIITAWLNAVAGVSGPLPAGSTNGARSVVESIPMEIP